MVILDQTEQTVTISRTDFDLMNKVVQTLIPSRDSMSNRQLAMDLTVLDGKSTGRCACTVDGDVTFNCVFGQGRVNDCSVAQRISKEAKQSGKPEPTAEDCELWVSLEDAASVLRERENPSFS